jgi:hypothetical protein
MTQPFDLNRLVLRDDYPSPEWAAPFEAQYPGDCSECEQPIKPGQAIARTRFPTGPGYHHVMCPVSNPREICDRCFMEKSITGACGCDD